MPERMECAHCGEQGLTPAIVDGKLNAYCQRCGQNTIEEYDGKVVRPDFTYTRETEVHERRAQRENKAKRTKAQSLRKSNVR